jgi:hypothetical protein
MFENILSLIRSFLCESHSKIKCYCNLKCCNKSNVDVPTPKIINIFNCVKKHSLDKIEVPFDKNITV